jgi:hypothetical protein
MSLLILAFGVMVLLAVVCWPLAIGLLLLWPILWLLSLPFRLIGLIVRALFAFLEAVLFLPARLLGWRPHS